MRKIKREIIILENFKYTKYRAQEQRTHDRRECFHTLTKPASYCTELTAASNLLRGSKKNYLDMTVKVTETPIALTITGWSVKCKQTSFTFDLKKFSNWQMW